MASAQARRGSRAPQEGEGEEEERRWVWRARTWWVEIMPMMPKRRRGSARERREARTRILHLCSPGLELGWEGEERGEGDRVRRRERRGRMRKAAKEPLL